MQDRKSFFKHYPKVDEFHFTSDGEAHFTEHEAKAHATSLDDKKVETVTRKEIDGKEEKAKAKVEQK